MMFFKKKPEAVKEPPKTPEPVMIYSTDDIMRRAEHIVDVLGYRGSVAPFVIVVYKLLKQYEELDEDATKQSETTDEHA
jgi:hypothetical protein